MLTIDIEITNHCNAKCVFCPRDAMPHEGIMRPEVFDQSLARAVEFRTLCRRLTKPLQPTIVFCGTGEPLVNRRAPRYVRCVREAGFSCQLATNGALLSRETALELLDAGLTWLAVNVSDIGEAYERVYQLPFSHTRDNVERFIELSRGRCEVCIIVVDHRRDTQHLDEVGAYWRSLGVDHVFFWGLVNRAGSVRIEGATLPVAQDGDPTVLRDGVPRRQPICSAPFMHLFIGYDGQYYLCSSDWRKEVSFGSIFERSFAEITAEKLARVSTREPICKRCTVDPVNLLMRRRRGADPTTLPPLAWTVDEIFSSDLAVRALASEIIASLATHSAHTPVVSAPGV